jgi:hypothetical protein
MSAADLEQLRAERAALLQVAAQKTGKKAVEVSPGGGSKGTKGYLEQGAAGGATEPITKKKRSKKQGGGEKKPV